jgi:hypothetical protein
MFVFAHPRAQAAPSTPTSTRQSGFDRAELLCFLVRLMIILGVVAMALQSHGVH